MQQSGSHKQTALPRVYARARARASYNRMRQFQVRMRRAGIAELLARMNKSPYDHGIQAWLARYFGLNRSTIHRDLRAIMREAVERHTCPLCQTHRIIIWKETLPADVWERLEKARLPSKKDN